MENKKTLKIVLLVIFLVIFTILILYFINISKIENTKENQIIKNTTKKVNKDYKELTNEEKVYFNNYFNDIILIALNNAIYDKLQTYDENLLQREESKFRFIYSYLVLNNYKGKITLEVINEYSNKFFKTNLSEENLKIYLKDGVYFYEVYKDKPYYCLKATKKEKEILVLDMISYDEIYCDKETISYDEKFFLKNLKLDFENEEDKLIFKSIKIERNN